MAIATPTAPLVHPAKAELTLRRLTLRDAARAIGVNDQVLGRQLNGLERATPRIRRGLSKLLGRPEDELFRPDEP
jgi:transcriptional regulator with XRE-family HTH domain